MWTALNHETLVRTANEIPPLPQSVTRLSELFADQNYTIAEVVRAVKLDSTLGGRLLRMANSSLYGTGEIASIAEAIVKLGSGTVKALAISSSVRPRKNIDLSAFGLTPEAYWNHCVAVVSFAEELAAQNPGIFGDDFATAALLHDFGKLVLAGHIMPEQVALMQSLDPGLSSSEQERQVLSVDHAEVTAVVAQGWNLPERLVRSVQHHHRPELFDDPTTHGISIANQLAWQLEGRNFDLDREVDSRQTSSQALRLNDDQLQVIFRDGCKRIQHTLSAYD